MKIPASKLKQVRQALGLTQLEFATANGMACSTVAMIEAGHNGLSLKNIALLLCHYHVSPNWLLNDTDEMFTYSKLRYSDHGKLSALTSRAAVVDALATFKQLYNATDNAACVIAGIGIESLQSFLQATDFKRTSAIVKLWTVISPVYDDPEQELELFIHEPKA